MLDADVDADGEATPEADTGRRAVARIVDTLVVGIPVSTAGKMLTGATPGRVGGAVLVGFAVLYFLYELPQLAIWGQTLGKRFAGVRVVDADGYGRVPAGRVLTRVAIYTVPLALRPVPFLGLVAGLFWLANGAWLLQRPLRQALHDKVARTAVVRTR